MSESRLKREAEYFDKVPPASSGEGARATAGKFYAVTRSSKGLYRELVKRNCAGSRILEYGCGPGSEAFELARRGAEVHAIDISEGALEIARRTAAEQEVADRITFHLMNAEDLQFEDGYFDKVCGSGILHHLDLEVSMKELARVMKPGARSFFFEPLGHNPFINLYRALTPSMRTPDEHPLLTRDLELIRESFNDVRYHYFHLTALLAAPFRSFPGFRAVVGMLNGLDGLLLRIRPLKRQAWIVVIELRT
jgi:SAM-dependent methyltransferase